MNKYKEIHNEYDMLQGDINRMFVSDDIDEIEKSMRYVLNRLAKIYQYNIDRVESKKCNEEYE